MGGPPMANSDYCIQTQRHIRGIFWMSEIKGGLNLKVPDKLIFGTYREALEVEKRLNT
jgi:hypothetical protein